MHTCNIPQRIVRRQLALIIRGWRKTLGKVVRKSMRPRFHVSGHYSSGRARPLHFSSNASPRIKTPAPECSRAWWQCACILNLEVLYFRFPSFFLYSNGKKEESINQLDMEDKEERNLRGLSLSGAERKAIENAGYSEVSHIFSKISYWRFEIHF